MLKEFGYIYDVNLFKPEQVSKKVRGKIIKNKDRLRKIFHTDVKIYNKVKNYSKQMYRTS
jgi:hypothetical protein